MPDVPRPALVTVANVELLKTGTWKTSTGEFTWEAADLLAAVAAQDDPAIRTPILKLGHDDPYRLAGEPTIGRVTKLRVSEDGQTLIGDLEGVPAWIAELMPTAWPSRSIEGCFGYQTQNGTSHRFVLTALALLGVEFPAVETLDDIASLYGVAASIQPVGGTPVALKFTERPMPAPVAASVSTEDIRRAYYDEAAWAWWICEIQIDPAQLIVENEDEGEMYRVPYSISGDIVTFDDPVKVAVTYVDVAAAAKPAKPPVVFASRAESRPDKPSRKPAASAPTGEKGGLVEVTDKIREALGLADDVTEIDEDTFLAKLGEIKDAAKPADPPAPDKPSPLPDGVVAIDETTLQELQVAASRGNAAHETLRKQTRDAFLTGAVQAGKFAPSRREHFATLYDADEEGTRTLIASLAANTVPVTELGNAGSDVTSDDALYAAIYPERFVKESSNG